MKFLMHLSFMLMMGAGLKACTPVQQVTTVASDPQQDQQGAVSMQVFYDNLSPYGQWIDYPQYGYVWAPSGISNFQPYTNGHWVMTEDGWTWISDYSWGWAPFHYGRWMYDNSYGWLWIPGTVWGPAWVSWRHSDGYYGWAPLGPEVGADISISFGNGYSEPANRWVFVPRQYMDRSDVNRYYLDRNQNTSIINNTTIINNTYVDNSRRATYISGPSADEVSRATGRSVSRLNIQASNTPGQTDNGHGGVRIFRPEVQNTVANNNKPAPAHVVSVRDFHGSTPNGQSQQNGGVAHTAQPNPNQRVNPDYHPAQTPPANPASPQNTPPRSQNQPDRAMNPRVNQNTPRVQAPPANPAQTYTQPTPVLPQNTPARSQNLPVRMANPRVNPNNAPAPAARNFSEPFGPTSRPASNHNNNGGNSGNGNNRGNSGNGSNHGNTQNARQQNQAQPASRAPQQPRSQPQPKGHTQNQ
jgi:hypothetical protein